MGHSIEDWSVSFLRKVPGGQYCPEMQAVQTACQGGWNKCGEECEEECEEVCGKTMCVCEGEQARSMRKHI